MKFLFIYQGGNPPQDKMEEYGTQWAQWISSLHEEAGVRAGKGHVVSQMGIQDYKGEIMGSSIIETESVEEARNIAKGCPSLPYGGSVIVIEEYTG